MAITQRRIIIFLFFLLIFGGAYQHAQADAIILQAIPAQESNLDRAPAQVELFFSQPLNASFSTIEVLNAGGKRVDNDDTHLDETDLSRMTVSLRSLPNGVYTVRWRAYGLQDSHIGAGRYTFTVGQGFTAVSPSPANPDSLFFTVSKLLTSLPLLALTGYALFAQLGHGQQTPGSQRRYQSLLLIFLTGSILLLLAQAGAATGRPVAVPWANSVKRVLFTTEFGALWIARLLVALALTAVLLRLPDQTQIMGRQRRLVLGAGLLMLLTLSLNSHARTASLWPLAVLAHWLHQIATAVWVGGALFWAAQLQQKNGRKTAVLLRQSLLWLGGAALVLLITGGYAAFSLGYGQAATNGRGLLWIKAVLWFGVVIVGGLIWRQVANVRGKHRRRKSRLAFSERSRPLMATAGMGVALALLLSAVLTAQPMGYSDQPLATAQQTAVAAGLTAELQLTPGRPGLNSFLVTLSTNDQPLPQTEEVLLRYDSLNPESPPVTIRLSDQGNGNYGIAGTFLALGSDWQPELIVRQSGGAAVTAAFQFSLPARPPVTPFRWHQVTGVLFALAGLLFVAAVSGHRQTDLQQLFLVYLPAGVFIFMGTLVFLSRPLTAVPGAQFALNPIPANIDSAIIGQVLYEENCLSCHGVTGKGDGPVGRTLNPPPSDLTTHAATDAHPDGQLFAWITDGIPNTTMPGFGETLSADNRWHLVNYIRTLAVQ